MRMRGSRWRSVSPRVTFVPVLITIVVAVTVAVPGIAFALFSAAPAGQSAAVAAATISPPTSFTATAAGAGTASLAWTGPATETGYTLTQSPGTLAGCPASPAASSTSCTATGLSPATSYTWTLTADYNNWASSGVTADAQTSLGLTDLGNGTASCVLASLLCTGPTVTTSSGSSDLVLVYLAGAGAGVGANPVVGGPFSSSSQLASVQYPTGSSGNYLYAFTATGSGGTSAVTVTFVGLSLTPAAWVDVIQLGSGESALACSGCTDAGTTTAGDQNATVSVTVQHAADSEIAFLGSTNGTFTAASGFTVVAGGGTSMFGSYADLAVQSSAGFPMGSSGLTWGSIGIEVQP